MTSFYIPGLRLAEKLLRESGFEKSAQAIGVQIAQLELRPELDTPSTPAPPAAWARVGERHPPPHAKYSVRRAGRLYTATPCYGMHSPWWVVKTLDGEAPPVPMQPEDEWQPAPEVLS